MPRNQETMPMSSGEKTITNPVAEETGHSNATGVFLTMADTITIVDIINVSFIYLPEVDDITETYDYLQTGKMESRRSNTIVKMQVESINKLLGRYCDREVTQGSDGEELLNEFIERLNQKKREVMENTKKPGHLSPSEGRALQGELDELIERVRGYLENGKLAFSDMDGLEKYYETPAVTAECKTIMAKYAERTGTEVPSWAK